MRIPLFGFAGCKLPFKERCKIQVAVRQKEIANTHLLKYSVFLRHSLSSMAPE